MEHRTHLHARVLHARGRRQGPHHPIGFVLADSGEGMDALRGENVEGGDAAEVAPEIAVGAGSDGAVVVEDVLSGEGAGSVGQGDVVFGETFLEGGGRRNDDGETRTEPEGEDVAVRLGHALEEAVEGALEEIEVADYGKRWWTWWKVFVLCSLQTEFESDEKRKEEEEKVSEEDKCFHGWLLQLVLVG